MNDSSFFYSYLSKLGHAFRDASSEDLREMVGMIQNASSKKNKVIIAGNGGSAAIASHVSVDLTKSAGIRCINFNESDLLTCLANDFGYENWVDRAIEMYSDVGDLVILISSSGRSPNIINAAKSCRSRGLGLITFSGFSADNELKGLGDINFWVNSDVYNIVETTHQTWLLAVVDFLAIQNDQ